MYPQCTVMDLFAQVAWTEVGGRVLPRRQAAAHQRAQLQPLKKSLRQLEQRIEKGQQSLQALQRKLADGDLYHEKDACVSMTGCIGSEDILFTIISKHARDSPYFLWTKEGEVNVIESGSIVRYKILIECYN